jgi:bis(5'-nucleosyl)-tetraphosphatase (symmetrical)
MATYVIGDIQGCFHSFQHLLHQVQFSPAKDRLWLVGDLVNRGSGSLEVLRWLADCQRQYPASITAVLGNHDLHALAVAESFIQPGRGDTLQALLEADDGDDLLYWLRHQRLAYAEDGYLMVHAGLLPQWDAAMAIHLAHEVEQALQGPGYRDFLARMYGNQPDRWNDDVSGMDRLRVITNAMTRLRVCSIDGVMELKFKGKPADIPEGYVPWFDIPSRKSADSTVIFGHWSALGLYLGSNFYALDTGCLWGGSLTALRLDDKQIFQVPCDPSDGPMPISD